MPKYARLDKIVEQMALWAMEYRNPAHHDGDVVAVLGGEDITIGLLRRAFERHFSLPFARYQESPRTWAELQAERASQPEPTPEAA